MRLNLENVEKIKNANIEFNGITVIAGINNSGKSTIGKMLYCIYNTFYNIEEQTFNELCKSVSRVIDFSFRETMFGQKRLKNTRLRECANEILAERDELKENEELLIIKIREYCNSIEQQNDEIEEKFFVKNVAEKIMEILRVDDDVVRLMILKKRLESEFAMKIGYVNDNEKTSVKLYIKDNESINFEVLADKSLSLKKYISLYKEIIYIDDPFILDELNSNQYFFLEEFNHRKDLLKKLKHNKSNTIGIVDSVLIEEKINRILDEMNNVCDGDIDVEEGEGFVYKTNRLNENLSLVNLSTGLKSFAILRKLLQNGCIDENGIIILDEPEIHLHPQWQIAFAKIIVLIQKEFNVNILLNTHSPYFLNAIEVYSEKYEIISKCKYYLTVELGEKTIVKDVTDNREDIYFKLAKPLQDLENQEYQNEFTL